MEDAVVAVKNEAGKIKLHQAVNLTAAGAVSGGFWGYVDRPVVLESTARRCGRCVRRSRVGRIDRVGIDDEFMKKLADGLQPNTSVLFVLVRKATPDKVVEEIKQYGGTVFADFPVARGRSQAPSGTE